MQPFYRQSSDQQQKLAGCCFFLFLSLDSLESGCLARIRLV
jgi:hypothetical protein